MKQRFLFAVMTLVMVLLPSSVVLSQTISISPTGYTSKPSYQSVNSWTGYTTSGGIYIKIKAVKSGSDVKFTIAKSSGTFQNSVTFQIRRDVEISGSSLLNSGSRVSTGSISSGYSSGTCVITPASGKHQYRVILVSGSIVFYTNPVTINVTEATLDTPDYTTFYASNITTTSFRANWSSVSGATQYNILVKKASDSDYSNPVYEGGTSNTYCNVTGLRPGTSYQFQIQAKNSSTKSNWSKSIQKVITTKSETLDTPDYTTFYASNITTTSFRANWSSVSGATQYNILVKKASDSDYSNPVYEGGTSNTYCNVTGLRPGTSYQFQIQAKNSSTTSNWSKSIQTAITTKSETLDTPDYTKFSATNITTTGFTANWAAVSGATQYNILVKKASDSDYSNPVYQGGTSSTSCKVTGLKPGTSYQFQIQAKNSTTTSNWSKSIQTAITTKSESTTLATPDYTKFSATNITTTGFTANWAAVSGATQYNILVKKASDSDYSNPVYQGGTSSTSCKVTGLKPGTSYQFQIQAKNSTTTSNWSKSIQTAITTKSESTTLATPDYTKFSATNITTTGFTANWAAVSGATQYYILVKKSSDSDYSNPVYQGGSVNTMCNVTGLKPGTSYQFQIQAANSTMSSNWSKSIQSLITTKGESTTLATPDYTKFSATNITTTGFTAVWSSVSGATQYNILVKKASDSDYSHPVYQGGSVNIYCKVTGLKPGTAYQFQIQAKNNYTTSNWSKSIQTAITTKSESTTLATPDYTKFSATNITTTGFTANWPAVTGATRYDILVKKASDSDYSNPVYSGGTSLTYCNVIGLKAGTSYQFQIRAKNDIAKSTWSKSIQTAIKTLSTTTAAPNLSIAKVSGFTYKTTLQAGKRYVYRVFVENRGTSNWTGSFYLREGTQDLKKWDNIYIPYATTGNSNASYEVYYVYTPQQSGEKVLTLYYKTKGESSLNTVKAGISYANPMKVNVNPDASVNNALKLYAAISYPQTLDISKTGNINAQVKNTGSQPWEGRVYLMDNDVTIGQVDNLGVGQVKSLNANNWKPDKTGTHKISVYYQTKNSSVKYAVDANGFANPVSVVVTNADVLGDASTVFIEHITRDVVPEEVTPGSVVMYYYRLLDENGKQLRNMKLRFKYTINGQTKYIDSEQSDLEGYAILAIPTNGAQAIASRGQTANLVCVNAINESNKLIPIKSNGIDNKLKLKIHQASAISQENGFENIEKVKIKITPGVSAKAEGSILSTKAKAKASIGVPIGLGLKYNDDGSVKEYSLEIGIKGDVSAGLSKSEEQKANSMLGSLSAGVSGGAGYKRSYTTAYPKEALIKLIMGWVDNSAGQVDWKTDLAIKVMRHWYDKQTEQKASDAKITKSWFYKYGLSAGLDPISVIDKWPRLDKIKETITPVFRIDELGISGDVNVVFEPWKTKIDKATGTSMTGYSSDIKLAGNFDFEGKVSNLWNWAYKRMSHTELFNKYTEQLLSDDFFYEKSTFNYSRGCEVKHEEMYNDQTSALEEVSQEYALSSSWELGTENIQIGDILTDGWKPFDVSIGYTSKINNKMTSKGGWAQFLGRQIVNKSEYSDLVLKVFPNLSYKTFVAPPYEIYQTWNSDIETPLRSLARITPNPDSYSLKNSLKFEHSISSELDLSVNIKVYDFGWAKFYIDTDLSLELENRPNESYFSVPEQRRFDVVTRPASSIVKVAGYSVKYAGEQIYKAFEEKKQSILESWDWLIQTYNLVVDAYGNLVKKVDDTIGDFVEDNIFYPFFYHWYMKDREDPNTKRAMARHAQLAEKEQVDICTFGFGINKDAKNFDAGVEIQVPHYYPAGDLLAITDKGDSLFVVSEVCDIIAKQGNDSLRTTQYGDFSIITHVGADDLTPFGFREDQELDVYYAEEGSKIWHYVGPAGTTLKTNKLGAYMMATSIKNDVVKPEIFADFDEQTGVIRINISENIGLRTNTLTVLLNGETKEFTAINESNFELELSNDDLQYMLNLKVSVYDLAGNQGSLAQTFQTDKPEKVNIADQPDTDITEMENAIYVESTSANAGKEKILSVKMKNSVEAEGFQFDLELPEGVSVVKDADGFPETYLSTERTTARKTNTFDCTILENGSLRVIAGSTNGSSISGNDGEVATVKLAVADNMESGIYPIVLRNIAISDTKAVSHDVEFVKSSIRISSVARGDANGDGKITITDAVSIVNYILGNPATDFNFSAADVNGDEKITITDAVGVVNMILNSNIVTNPARDAVMP